MILAMAVPLSATRIATSLLSTTENILIPQQLQKYGQNAAAALSAYGELTGMAMPLLLLPPRNASGTKTASEGSHYSSGPLLRAEITTPSM